MARFFRLCALAVLSLVPSVVGAAEVHLGDANASPIDINVPPQRTRPVLFVHGHAIDFELGSDNTTDDPADPNYKKNWWNGLDGLPSFKQTFEHPSNSWLDIEPYFIRFEDQAHSITEDARDIQQAVDDIIRRHNPNFDPSAPSGPPPVQLVIIAYSKGTISTRQYLKSLQAQVQDAAPSGQPRPPPLNQPRPNYRPVSDFIAISPPNHGLDSPLFRSTTKLSVQQLYDGVTPANLFGTDCGDPYNNPQADNFMTNLNGHALADTLTAPFGNFASEAPGSRQATAPPQAGTLYVTLFAESNADMVGGETDSGDCRGRAVASNLSADAINIPIAGIGDNNALTPNLRRLAVHANTVHTPQVICRALIVAAHHRPLPGQDCSEDAQTGIPTIPQPAAAMLALDTSGSMLARECSACPTRYDILKQAVEIFARLWLVMGGASDRLGVTYFRTTIDERLIAGDRLPMLTVGNVDAIVLDVNGQNVVSANLTAIGGGLQRSVEALRALPAAAAKWRHVILFSDGMQNVNPMVQPPQTNPDQLEISDQPGRPASGVMVSSPPMNLDTLSDVKVDTIAVGAGAFVGLLADVAAKARGLSRATTDANDLRQFYVEQLIDTLRESSPQLVGYRRGTLSGTSATESFLVDKGARKLVLKVSWQLGQRLDVRAFKDGVDVTNAAQIAAGEFYRILAVSSPPSGEWRLRLAGKPGTAYEVAAIVDQKDLRYQARLGSLRDQVGAPLGLAVQVLANRRPIDGPIAVTATITRPRVAIGNVLAAVKPLKAGSPGSEPGMPEAERRVAAFLQDPRRHRNLRQAAETVRLDGDSRSGFRAVLANANTPGLYRAVVRIQGEDHQLGRFERSETVTTIVRFGEADRARSALALRALPGSQEIELTLRPADRRGNLLGPTFAAGITLALSGGKIVRGPDDLGDGRYRFVLSLPEGEDPTFTLLIANRVLIKGMIKELRDALRR